MDLVQNGLISILVVQILSTFAIKGYSGLAASPLQGGSGHSRGGGETIDFVLFVLLLQPFDLSRLTHQKVDLI